MGRQSGRHRPSRVTTDGTASRPYRSPSQADDGTIAASHGDEIVRLRQDGTEIGRFDPPPLTDSVSHPVDGVPVSVAISPDGTRIAYTFTAFSCPVGASCGARSVTGVTSADGTASPAGLAVSHHREPSWAGNGRILEFGGYLSQVNVHDIGGEARHWFDDQDVRPDDATDLGDGEITRDGRRFAAVRGYGSGAHIVWYRVTGDALRGPVPGPPEPLCATGRAEGLEGPTWAPDASGLAWQENDGVWVKPAPDDCTLQPRLVLPGASEPHWGPAPVAPGPGRGPAPAPGPAAPVTAPPAATLGVAAAPARVGAVLRRGLPVRVRVATPGLVRATARLGGRVVASRAVRVARPGTVVVWLRPGRAARRALAPRRSARLRVTVTLTAKGATARRTVTVRLGR